MNKRQTASKLSQSWRRKLSVGPFGSSRANILYRLTPPVKVAAVVFAMGVAAATLAMSYASPGLYLMAILLACVLLMHCAALVMLALVVLDERGSL